MMEVFVSVVLFVCTTFICISCDSFPFINRLALVRDVVKKLFNLPSWMKQHLPFQVTFPQWIRRERRGYGTPFILSPQSKHNVEGSSFHHLIERLPLGSHYDVWPLTHALVSNHKWQACVPQVNHSVQDFRVLKSIQSGS